MEKSREIFDQLGNPRKKEDVERAEERARLQMVENAPKDPELQEFLANIDFGLLKSIFQKIAEKSGIDPKTLNFLERERISPLVPDWTSAGCYFPDKNIIGISASRIAKIAEDLGAPENLLLLSTLCHEETHATSKVMCSGSDNINDFPIKIKTLTGYHSSTREQESSGAPSKRNSLFQLFNEGVTEKLAREVLKLYIASFGEGTGVVKKFEKMQKEIPEELPYTVAIKFIETFSKRLAYETHVSEDSAWRALVRGMYEGEDMLNWELWKELDMLITPGFVERLADGDLHKLFPKLAIPLKNPINGSVQWRISRLIKKFGKFIMGVSLYPHKLHPEHDHYRKPDHKK
ncbi:MAG: hypothetical protein HYT12_01290 [Candidatus Liptonbacteria bacterium]|nr:hypothetical protein [Candidatus Liptonbacteria bacterium]